MRLRTASMTLMEVTRVCVGVGVEKGRLVVHRTKTPSLLSFPCSVESTHLFILRCSSVRPHRPGCVFPIYLHLTPPSPQVQKAAEPQDASQGLEEAVVPRQHADTPYKRTKRSWVLPPINVAENMQGPFPKDILTVRPPHLHATHARTGTHSGTRVRPQKRREEPVQIALTHTRVPQFSPLHRR